jgi:hydroxymethylglutaryl-CoA reductase
VAASRFAEDDPYRAATHNKGIMNGVDGRHPTGNDWRGVRRGPRSRPEGATGRSPPGAPTARPDRAARDADGRRDRGRHIARHAGRAWPSGFWGSPTSRRWRRSSEARGWSNLAALRARHRRDQRGHMALHRRSSQPLPTLVVKAAVVIGRSFAGTKSRGREVALARSAVAHPRLIRPGP